MQIVGRLLHLSGKKKKLVCELMVHFHYSLVFWMLKEGISNLVSLNQLPKSFNLCHSLFVQTSKLLFLLESDTILLLTLGPV